MNLFIFREIRFKLLLFYFTLTICVGALYQLLASPYPGSHLFLSPIPTGDETALVIRNDPGGQGHFGASRNGGRSHTGIDISAPLNSEIFSTKAGRVIRSFVNGGYGEFIEILHVDGSTSRYGHLSRRQVQKGQWVHDNQVIGNIGKTGNADGEEILPHLHFEIRIKDIPVDPLTQIITSKESQNFD